MSCIDGITSEKVAPNPPLTHKRSRRTPCPCPVDMRPLTLADHQWELQRLRGKVDQHYEFIARHSGVLDNRLLAHLNKLIDWRLNRIDECELEQAEAKCAALRKRIAARGEQVFG